MQEQKSKYHAFISYSHKDKKWADWLHRFLESYRVPKKLVGKETPAGPVPKRLFPVFRDREELPVSADLSANIQEALKQSKYLIVICSPNAAKSKWVNEEILAYKKLGGEGRILCLIVDGEPNATDKGLAEQECFPEALKYKMGTDGNPRFERTEPIAADVRKGMDGKENARLKITAGLLGVGFDELRQRETLRIKRNRMIGRIVALISTIIILVALFVFFVLNLKSTLMGHGRDTFTANDFIENNDTKKAFDIYIKTFRDKPVLAFIVEFMGILWNKPIDNNSVWLGPRDSYIIVTCNDSFSIYDIKGNKLLWKGRNKLNKDQRAILMKVKDDLLLSKYYWNNGTIILTNQEHGNKMQIDSTGRIGKCSGDEKYFYTYNFTDSLVSIYLCDSLKIVNSFCLHKYRGWLAEFTNDSRNIAVVFNTGIGEIWTDIFAIHYPLSSRYRCTIYDIESGAPLFKTIKIGGMVTSMSFSDDDTYLLLTACDKKAYIIDKEKGDIAKVFKHKDWVLNGCFNGRGDHLATCSADSTAMVWDLNVGNAITGPLRHNGWVMGCQFAGESKLITYGTDNAVKVWDLTNNGAEMHSLAQTDLVREIRIVGDSLIVACWDETVTIWSIDAGKTIWRKRFGNAELWYHRAMEEYIYGNINTAKEYLGYSLEIDPNFQPAKMQKSKIYGNEKH